MTRLVTDLLRRSARLVPDRPAIIVDGARPGESAVTFAELAARSVAFAHGLRQRGVGHGDRVALVFGGEDWIQYAIAYFGLLRLGAVAMLTGTRFADADLAAVVDGYQVTGVVRAPELAVPSLDCPVWDAPEVEVGSPSTTSPTWRGRRTPPRSSSPRGPPTGRAAWSLPTPT